MGCNKGKPWTPEYKAFYTAKGSALRRGKKFEFSFEEWVRWWETHLGADWLRLRGRQKDQFVMARLGDAGSYCWGNVECITVAQNGKDKHKNWRSPWGNEINTCKLTPNEVREIFLSKDKQATLARQYAVTPKTIERIRIGRTWRHVTDELRAGAV